MSTSLDKYGSNVRSNGFLAVPSDKLDIPIYDSINPTAFPDYYIYDVDEVTVIGGMTINEHLLANSNRRVMPTAGGLYVFYGLLIPMSQKGQEAILNIMESGDLTFGEDYTTAETNKYFTMNYIELEEWLSVSPHNGNVVE